MPLTDAAVRAAQLKAKPYKLTDAMGLYLLVNAKGRYWRLDYRFEGRRKTLALGVYPETPLSAARARREDARELLRKGIDPSAAKQAAKGRNGADAEDFETIGREWFSKKARKWAKSHSDKVLLRLEGDIFPWIGKRPARNLLPIDFLNVARRVEKRGAIESAHRVVQYCSSIMRYAVATSRASSDPTRDLRGALSPIERGHFAAIRDPEKLGPLLQALERYPGTFVVGIALRLAPRVFARPTELRHMEWAELDLDNAMWRVPASKMKMRREHMVPLSRQAVEILREIHPLTGAGKYVFPGMGKDKTKPISENTLVGGLRRLGYNGDEMTAHGFRSTASTLLNEKGWNPDVIERQLAHEDEDESRAAYNYAQWLPDRRKMMQEWADYLDELKASAVSPAK